jgi:hypothetical protein
MQAVEKLQKQRKLARANQVTLFRSYRQGELPDIQIKNSDVLLVRSPTFWPLPLTLLADNRVIV